MSATRTQFATEAVAYHGSLADGMGSTVTEKSSFQMRQAVLENCLRGEEFGWHSVARCGVWHRHTGTLVGGARLQRTWR
jgi:hypothetical protein